MNNEIDNLNETQYNIILQIRKSCKICAGLGAVSTGGGFYKKCECSLKQEKLIKYYYASIPEKFINLTKKDCVYQEIPPITNYIENIRNWITRGIGLYLYGPNGTGKTFILSMIAKAACDVSIATYFCSLEQFLHLILESRDNENIKNKLEYIKNCNLLCIDEIEKIYKPSRDMSFADIIFDDLFRTRSNDKKTICVTSNLSVESLKGIHGKHLVSLFLENIIPIEL